MNEKRLHRCCFTGYRPEKLKESEQTVKKWLELQIDQAIADGFVTFITGCAMGVDIWAAQIVLERRQSNPAIHLIAATPFPGFGNRWKPEWRMQYNSLLRAADLVKTICLAYEDACFQKRNEWMVDHSSRVIAYYNGAPGGTRNTIEYALGQGITVVQNL